ncbi:MAG: Stk1 family PASTA domain-containing Ser/Thr kinase [Eubacteriales bacterium]|nr:Stk1 family PASTA domain-containing Ser/Thr kinase [Eubacteriales bacterium]
MLKTGMIVGDRYEVVSKIGTGGMANVYKAKDHKLNRFVAMKVLKQEFREDTTFIKKFKTEAQSAAGLTHPNIVNVFDVGEDDGIHYIVMELVEGITLKDYISKKGKLSVKEATSIAIQVSMGLEAAHSHGIIHRDVKPQNIIISTDGKVKVTDFGIARAASSNTISSNVMGSVHYSSPEQVRGGYSDEKSDIYSLGITLYEMITGRVPFEGETTVAIAIKHLQDEMVPPSEYTPDIPHSLEQIILKCTQKSVDKRYASMGEVIGDLKHSLIDPNGNFVQLYTMDPTEKTMVIGEQDLQKIKQKRAEAPVVTNKRQEAFIDENDLDDDDDEKGGLHRGLEKAMMIGGFIVGALIIVVLLVYIVNMTGLFKGGIKKNPTEQSTAEEKMIEVPNLVGKTEDEAVESVKNSGIGIRYVGEEPSDEYEKGIICYQETEAGTEVPENSTINYKLSSGSALLNVPDVTGKMQGEAEAMLTEMGFVVNVSKSYSYDYQAGQVMSQNPTVNTQAKAGDTINLEVSMGAQYDGFTVPSVVGMAEADAKNALAPLDVVVQSEASETVPAGQVTTQSLAEGVYVDKGTTITITVSTGPADATPIPTVTATGTWKCTQVLDTPIGYQNGVVKMELVQMVNGSPQASTVVEGKQVEFPYQLDLTGAPGVTEGTLYLYELIGSDYVELGHYPIKFEQVEE